MFMAHDYSTGSPPWAFSVSFECWLAWHKRTLNTVAVQRSQGQFNHVRWLHNDR